MIKMEQNKQINNSNNEIEIEQDQLPKFEAKFWTFFFLNESLLKGVLNSNFRPFSFELRKKLNFLKEILIKVSEFCDLGN